MSRVQSNPEGYGSLTRARVTEAAIEILDESGMAGLSIRGLAQRLQRSTMAMYRHAKNKDEVIEFAAETVEAEAEPEAGLPSPTWEGDVEQFIAGSVGRFEKHPWLIDYHVNYGTGTTGAARRMERLLNALGEAGFGDDEIKAALFTLWSEVVGLATTLRMLKRQNRSQSQSLPDPPSDRLIAFASAVVIDGLKAAVARQGDLEGAES